MSRPMIVVTALVAAALGSATSAWLATRTTGEQPTLDLLQEPDSDRKSARRPRRPFESLRPEISQEEQQVLPGLHGRGDVDAYLHKLAERARAQGRVSAVEVEPGMSAIFALRGQIPEGELLAMADDFDGRMQALTAELGATPRPSPPDFDDALGQVHHAEDPAAREAAIRQALDALEPLPEPARLDAEARLDEALRDRGAPEATPPDLDGLRQAITDHSDGAAHDDAVRRYVEAVENLPREQAEALLAEIEPAPPLD